MKDSEVEYQLIQVGVDRLTADRYRDYKNRAHSYYEEHGPTSSYDTIGMEDWQKCVDLFTDPIYIVSITFILYHTITL